MDHFERTVTSEKVMSHSHSIKQTVNMFFRKTRFQHRFWQPTKYTEFCKRARGTVFFSTRPHFVLFFPLWRNICSAEVGFGPRRIFRRAWRVFDSADGIIVNGFDIMVFYGAENVVRVDLIWSFQKENSYEELVNEFKFWIKYY